MPKNEPQATYSDQEMMNALGSGGGADASQASVAQTPAQTQPERPNSLSGWAKALGNEVVNGRQYPAGKEPVSDESALDYFPGAPATPGTVGMAKNIVGAGKWAIPKAVAGASKLAEFLIMKHIFKGD